MCEANPHLHASTSVLSPVRLGESGQLGKKPEILSAKFEYEVEMCSSYYLY